MALTRDQVINSSDILDSVSQNIYIVLFRSNDTYRQSATVFYADVATRLANASGTIKGRMLNALLDAIDKLGVGVVKIRGDKDGVQWSQEEERNNLITEALNVLYDPTVEGLALPDNWQGYVNTTVGLYGTAAVGQRALPCDPCTAFMCYCGACSTYNSTCT